MLDRNINRTGLMKCRGSIMPIQTYLNMVYDKSGMIMSKLQAEDLQRTIYALEEENIVIPLERNQAIDTQLLFSSKGFRPIDYRVLTTEQIKAFHNINDQQVDRVITPYHPNLTCASVINDGNMTPLINEVEKYDKMINITYLVDNETLLRFLDGGQYEEKYVAEKKIKDATVDEMLFALNKKLEKEK